MLETRPTPGDQIPSCLEVVCAVNSMFREIKEDVCLTARSPQHHRTWTPPHCDFLKINFDGSFRKEDKAGACGFIIRNHLGEPAGAANFSPTLDALSAETVSCLFALESAGWHLPDRTGDGLQPTLGSDHIPG